LICSDGFGGAAEVAHGHTPPEVDADPRNIHSVARDEQAFVELTGIAPCPREDARPHDLLSRQE